MQKSRSKLWSLPCVKHTTQETAVGRELRVELRQALLMCWSAVQVCQGIPPQHQHDERCSLPAGSYLVQDFHTLRKVSALDLQRRQPRV